MSSRENKFYAKVLLFGEYSILKGADALTIPHKDYFGQLKLDRSKLNRMGSHKAKDLLSFAFYLKELNQKNKFTFDLDLLFEELDQGLYFSSNIPMGHGLGSSGALSAALYDRYVKPVSESVLNDDLRQKLAIIEQFYHKKSSGMDPLLSFFGKPLYRKNMVTDFADIPNFNDFNKLRFFMIDTHQSRQTDKLVDLFHHMDQSGELGKKDFNDLCIYNNNCIKNFLSLDEEALFESFKLLSETQIKCLTAMIPLEFAKSWRKLLKEEHTYLKLCGAGGGGFLIGVTKNLEAAEFYFKDYHLEFLD